MGIFKSQPQIIERTKLVSDYIPISKEAADRLKSKGFELYTGEDGRILLNVDDVSGIIERVIDKFKDKVYDHYILLDAKIETGTKNVDDKVEKANLLTKEYEKKIIELEKSLASIDKLDVKINNLNTSLAEKAAAITKIDPNILLSEFQVKVDEASASIDSKIKELEDKFEANKQLVSSEAYKQKMNQIIGNRMDELIMQMFAEKGIVLDSLIADAYIDIEDPKFVIKNLIKLINLTEDRNGKMVRVLDAKNIEAHSEKLKELLSDKPDLKEDVNSVLRSIDLYLDNPGKSNLISKDGEILISRLRKLSWKIENIGDEQPEVIQVVETIKKERKPKPDKFKDKAKPKKEVEEEPEEVEPEEDEGEDEEKEEVEDSPESYVDPILHPDPSADPLID